MLDSVERLPRSARTAAVASALPLVILPALGPGLPLGFIEADGMPPAPDKARTGRFFGRHVMEFQRLQLLWQAEFPNSRTRYTMKSVRTGAISSTWGGATTTGPGRRSRSTTTLGILCSDMPYF